MEWKTTHCCSKKAVQLKPDAMNQTLDRASERVARSEEHVICRTGRHRDVQGELHSSHTDKRSCF